MAVAVAGAVRSTRRGSVPLGRMWRAARSALAMHMVDTVRRSQRLYSLQLANLRVRVRVRVRRQRGAGAQRSRDGPAPPAQALVAAHARLQVAQLVPGPRAVPCPALAARLREYIVLGRMSGRFPPAAANRLLLSALAVAIA